MALEFVNVWTSIINFFSVIKVIMGNAPSSEEEVQVFSCDMIVGLNMAEYIRKSNDDFVDADKAPVNVVHGGIVVYGKCLDFTVEGIKVLDLTKYKADWPSLTIESTFRTVRTASEINGWTSRMASNGFRADQYVPISNDCCTFVVKLCEFLGGRVPSRIRCQIDWFQKNEEILRPVLDKNLPHVMAKRQQMIEDRER